MHSVFAHPRIAGVTRDGENPCATVAVGIFTKSAISPQVSFLHNILSIISVPAQVTCQVIGPIEVRLEQFLKLFALASSKQYGLPNELTPA
jgi:hypothetical protein